jgi:alanine-glyoxylate transaminase / serine-glyoxylate transaminase / serine-pyruvate transaminase
MEILNKSTMEEMLSTPNRLLVGAGPGNLDPRVARALTLPLLSHLDPSFWEIMDSTADLLRQVFKTENEATLLLPATGMAGMETMFANLIEPGDKALIGHSGHFGSLMVEVASRQGAEVSEIQGPEDGAIDEEEFIEKLDSDDFAVAATVHAETATGTFQPVQKIAAACQERDTLFLMDAVTSLGGMDVRVDEWGVDACYSGTQKCLSIPSGGSPITFSERAMRKVRNRKQKPCTYYFDIQELMRYWSGGMEKSYHHTAAIPLVYATHEALRVLLEEGLENAFERHIQCSKLLLEEIKPLGFRPFAQPEYRLPMITAVTMPEGLNAKDVRTRLREEWNIETDLGLGEIAEKILRIGLKGYSAQPRNAAYVTLALSTMVGAA